MRDEEDGREKSVIRKRDREKVDNIWGVSFMRFVVKS
jgi:hypothetical protein